MFYKGRTEPVVEELSVVQDELAKDLKEKKMRVAMAQRFDDIRDGAQIDNFLSGASQSGRTGRPQASTRTKASPASVKISRPASQSPKLIRPASRKTATQPE